MEITRQLPARPRPPSLHFLGQSSELEANELRNL